MSSTSETVMDEATNRKASRLVEEILTFQEQRSGLNAEIKAIKEEEEKAEIELMELLEANGKTIELAVRVKNIKIVGLSTRSGGGFFMKPWEKQCVKFAQNETKARNKGLI